MIRPPVLKIRPRVQSLGEFRVAAHHLAQVGKRRTLSPLTPGMFAIWLRSVAHRREQSENCTHGRPSPRDVWDRFQRLEGRIMAPRPSYHTEMEKMRANLRFSQSFFRYRTYHSMSALFCIKAADAIFKQFPAIFVNFSRFSVPFCDYSA